MSSPVKDDFFVPITSDDFFTPIDEPSRMQSLLSATPKGALKGAQEFVSMSPFSSIGPIPTKLGEKLIEKALPTQKKTPEKILERAGKLGTYLAGGEGGLISKGLRTAAGALAGQGLEEIGAPKLAQDIAEIGAMSAPQLAKNIPAKAAQSRIVNFLRGKGFTENEIAPLLNSPEKLSRYAKFSAKGKKTNALMRDIYQKFDGVYQGIREEGQKMPGLSGDKIDVFLEEFQSKFDKIPKMFRRMLQEEVDDLLNSDMKFSDFIDFNQAINARIKGTEGGKSVLGILKEPIQKAQKAINPSLAEDFQLANELYGKRANIGQHLKTKEIEDLIDLGEAATLTAGIADQNYSLISKVLGIHATRKIAREMLINPRLQNLSTRMLKAIKNNQLPLARKILHKFMKEADFNEKDIEQQKPQ